MIRRSFLASTIAAPISRWALAHGSGHIPPQDSRKPLMKLSLAAYSFNRQLARRGTPEQIAAARMTLEKFIDFCADQQLGATELTGYYFPKTITPEYLFSILNKTHRLGLDISGTAIGNDFCLAPGPQRDAELKMCRDWIDYAATMGAPIIRIFAGKVPKGGNEDESIKLCVAGIRESLDYAATKGVFLALENHGGITATPEKMLRIIDGVKDSPWFGVNFDSGNFKTDDPYGDLAKIAPYAINAQIKVDINPGGAGNQAADLPRIIGILKDSGYRGYVTLEYEREDPFEAIPKYLDQLRKLII